MTKPKLANDKGRDDVRTYSWPPLPPHDLEVVSVTSILNNFPKPWLVGWAVKMTAERAIDKYDFLGAMIQEDKKGALKWLKDARWSSSSSKADRGTVVHGALEAHIAGRSITPDEIEAQLTELRVEEELWRAAVPMVAGLMQFLDDEEPEIYWSEQTVFSRQYGYAGTPDLVCNMRIGGTLQPVILDVKTSPRIYDETALQLCAYARADFVGLEDGTEAPLLPKQKWPPKFGVVVRPKADGGYEKAVFTLESEDDVLFRTFLACLELVNAGEVVRKARRP